MNSLFGSTKKVVIESAPVALEQAGIQLKEVENSVKNSGAKVLNDIKKFFSN